MVLSVCGGADDQEYMRMMEEARHLLEEASAKRVLALERKQKAEGSMTARF